MLTEYLLIANTTHVERQEMYKCSVLKKLRNGSLDGQNHQMSKPSFLKTNL